MQNQQPPPGRPRRFETVASVASLLDVSEVTIYRAIHAGEFPAIKVRGRYVIPSSVVDAMERAALSTGSVVDAAEWSQPDAGAQATGLAGGRQSDRPPSDDGYAPWHRVVRGGRAGAAQAVAP